MRFAMVLGLSVLSAAQALAASGPTAENADFSGKILISHGKGFSQAISNISLKAGDSIFIGDNSSITIAYQAAKCSVTYSTPQTFNVPAKAPCHEGQMLGQIDNLTVEPANGANRMINASRLISIPSNPAFLAEGIFAITSLSALYAQTRNRASAP